jgi:hypothetical protein
VDDQHSYIGFRIKYFGSSNVRGRFDKFLKALFSMTRKQGLFQPLLLLMLQVLILAIKEEMKT